MTMTALPATAPPYRPPVRVFEAVSDLADDTASIIVRSMTRCREENRPFVLGLAAGASPAPVYAALSARRQKDGVDFGDMITFALDEYYPMAHHATESFFHQLAAVLDDLGVSVENRHFLGGDVPLAEVAAHCEAYDAAIRAAGDIDIQLLGVGQNGHIGFNEPGSPVDARTRLVHLHDSTRQDATAAFGTLESVPSQAVTMGIGTILAAKRILLLAHGAKKAPIVKKIIEEEVMSRFPASFLKNHPAAEVLVDLPAAALLDRRSANSGGKEGSRVG